jgi:hypothetical protein
MRHSVSFRKRLFVTSLSSAISSRSSTATPCSGSESTQWRRIIEYEWGATGMRRSK